MVSGQRVALLATTLALRGSQDRPSRFVRDQRPLAALVPSTRPSNRASGDGLTICAPALGLSVAVIEQGERIEERRDQ